jgi:hypothetical protein
VLLHDLQEASVFNVPERLDGLVLDEESAVGQQLAELFVARELLEAGKLLDQLEMGRLDHGTWSPILGSPA